MVVLSLLFVCFPPDLLGLKSFEGIQCKILLCFVIILHFY